MKLHESPAQMLQPQVTCLVLHNRLTDEAQQEPSANSKLGAHEGAASSRLWDGLCSAHEQTVSFRDATLDQWYRQAGPVSKRLTQC